MEKTVTKLFAILAMFDTQDVDETSTLDQYLFLPPPIP